MSGVNRTTGQYVTYQRTTGDYSQNKPNGTQTGEKVNDDLKNGLKGNPEHPVDVGLGVERTGTEEETTSPQEHSQEAENQPEEAQSRKLGTRAERKQARKELEQQFLQYGKSDGTQVSKKEAKQLAKNYVENEHNREEAEFTQVFMDKKEYKAAEKERKAQRKELIEQYRKEGMSKKEARQKAESQLVENTYLRKGLFGQRKTREFIEEHKSDFYENGKFSSDKFKAKAVEYANTHTLNDETTNYHLSLKERRSVAQQLGTKASVIKNIAKKSNISYEKDNTNLYRGLAIGGSVGIGLASAPLLGSSSAAAAASSSSSAAAAGAGAAAGSSSAAASAAASASVNGFALGTAAGGGIGLGLASLIKDPGKKEARVYAPGKPEVITEPPKPDKPTLPPPEDKLPDPPKPIAEEQPCPEERWESEVCDHLVQKGDNWSAVAQAKVLINGKKPDGKLLRAYVHAEKLKHGVTDFKLNTMPEVYRNGKDKEKCTLRLYSDFSDLLADEEILRKYPELQLLKDVQITFNCDGKVDHRGTVGKPKTPYTRWFGSMTNPVKYKQDCHDPEPVMVK